MKLTTVTAVFSAAVLAAASNIALPAGVPRSIQEFREKHPYKPSTPSGHGKRRVVKIRSSRNDTDDISSDFKKALQRANHGGTVYLPANETFIIGRKHHYSPSTDPRLSCFRILQNATL
jgi:galacturan 1,4-alpha-galacturonidase